MSRLRAIDASLDRLRCRKLLETLLLRVKDALRGHATVGSPLIRNQMAADGSGCLVMADEASTPVVGHREQIELDVSVSEEHCE